MKKLVNGLFAAIMLVAVGQCVSITDVERLKDLLESGRRINMPGAFLRKADLSGLDLSNADLPGADLRNADLTNANLTNINLYRAKLAGADFEGATGLLPALREDANRQGAINVP